MTTATKGRRKPKLSPEKRREMVRDLRAKGHTEDIIAALLGVSQPQISRLCGTTTSGN